MGYDRIVHIFSFSKSFGMPGWRVGYMVYPTCLTDSMRKLQDAIPTHAPVFSQFLAEMCLEHDDSVRSQAKEGSSAPLQTQSRAGEEGASWVEQQVADLAVTREAMWDAVQDMGTVHTQGAFYFLVPVPEGVSAA
jgi:aspartate/methionine/tyrosine aminotransferase